NHFNIERREPTQEELDNEHIWAVDVGDQHEPEKLNFDHHQSLSCPASFVLVADHLGLSETMSVLPWWQFKDSVDRFGPVKSSAIFHAGDDLVNRSPVEDWLTMLFAHDPQGSLAMLRTFGDYVIEHARTLKSQIDFWKTCRRLLISGIPAMIGETSESAGLEEFRRLVEDPPDVVISRARRGEGWRLFRYEGAAVDFSRIADSPQIEFAHKSGFMAKTAGLLPIEDVITLVSRAVIRL
ncbi:MAG: hypothetical protein JXM72_10120, partial [Deltaproteobacteria bacterium]|nr:hypothetical protein [Deltaproteobacteria bacterium]